MKARKNYITFEAYRKSDTTGEYILDRVRAMHRETAVKYFKEKLKKDYADERPFYVREVQS